MATPAYAVNPGSMHEVFAAAFNAGDLEALVALYEPDAVLLPGATAEARGHEAIRAVLPQFLAGGAKISIETTAVLETRDGLALTNGRWTLRGTAPDGHPFETGGTTAEVLRRQPDGRWLYILDNPFAAAL